MRKPHAPIPRIALTPPEAAAALGVGPDFLPSMSSPRFESCAGVASASSPSRNWRAGLDENAEQVLGGRARLDED